MGKIIYLGTERVKQLRDWVKSHVSSAISNLSEVYAPKQHQHKKEDVTDLVDATDSKGGLMTDNQAQKLATVKNNAEPNVITTIKVNNNPISPDNKEVNIVVPTDNASLSNGAGYADESKVNEILTAKLAGIRSIEYEVVQSLPQSGEIGKFYLIKTSESDAGDDIYDEYIYVNDRFEKIGTKAMDLSGYLQESEIDEMSQETLAGILAE